MPVILLIFNAIATVGILSYAFGEFDPAENETDERGLVVAEHRERGRAAGLTRREI